MSFQLLVDRARRVIVVRFGAALTVESLTADQTLVLRTMAEAYEALGVESLDLEEIDAGGAA